MGAVDDVAELAPPASTGVGRRLAWVGAYCACHARTVAAIWILILAAAGVGAYRAPELLSSGSGDIPGSVSLHVDDVLRNEFLGARAQVLILALSSQSLDRDRVAVLSLIESVRERLEKETVIQEVMTEEDIPNKRLLPAAGTGHVFILSLKAHNNHEAETAVPRIRGAIEPLLKSAKARYHDLEWAITGRAALTHDMSSFSARDTKDAELRALLPTVLVLVLAFGSLAATTLPIIVGIAGVTLALGLVCLLAQAFVVSDVVLSVASMIGLAVGVDYSLFFIHRYRQEVPGQARGMRMARAMEAAGPVILYSGLTVLVGMAGLTTTLLVEIRSIGLGGCLVVAATVLLTLTLLPAIISLIGDGGLEWPRALSSRLQDQGQDRWKRWALLVTRHPFMAAVIGLAIVLGLSAPGLQSRFGVPEPDLLPKELEYVRGMQMLDRMGLRGLISPMPILLTNTAAGPVLTDERIPALLGFAARLRRDGCVSVVVGPIDLFDTRYVSADGRRMLLHVIPRGCTFEELKALGRAIPGWLEMPELRAEVGGLPQYYEDVETAAQATYARSVAFVLAGTCVLLLVAFRAPVVVLKALFLNASSVMAGYGMVVLVFQLGYGSHLLGVAAPTEVIPISVPLLIFCILFGLSMDYEVFLLSRTHAAFLRTGDNTQSVREALADTGPVITSAALIMVVVFGAFAMAKIVLVQMIGLGLAVAVLVDATVIRSLLGPALMQLAGRWNWWPTVRIRASDSGPAARAP